MHVKEDSKPFQATSRCMTYALPKPLKEKLQWLQQLVIIVLLGADEAAELCSSFVLVPKLNGKARLCLDPARLNHALIRPVDRGPTVNDIFPIFSACKVFNSCRC